MTECRSIKKVGLILINFRYDEEHRNSTVINFLTLNVSPLKQTFYHIKTFNVFLLFYCLNSLLVI